MRSCKPCNARGEWRKNLVTIACASSTDIDHSATYGTRPGKRVAKMQQKVAKTSGRCFSKELKIWKIGFDISISKGHVATFIMLGNHSKTLLPRRTPIQSQFLGEWTNVNKSGSDIDITGDLNPNILMCKSEIFKDQGLILITLEHMARARELLGLHPTLYEIGEQKYVPNLWASSQFSRENLP